MGYGSLGSVFNKNGRMHVHLSARINHLLQYKYSTIVRIITAYTCSSLLLIIKNDSFHDHFMSVLILTLKENRCHMAISVLIPQSIYVLTALQVGLLAFQTCQSYAGQFLICFY